MERLPSDSRPDFDLDPASASAWLIDGLLGDRNGRQRARSTRAHLSRQPSSFTSTASLLDQHFDLLVATLFGRVREASDITRGVFLRAVACLASSVPSSQAKPWPLLLTYAVLSHDDAAVGMCLSRVPSQDWPALDRRIIPLLSSQRPWLPALAPLGVHLIERVSSSKSEASSAAKFLDAFVAWAGVGFLSSLSEGHRAILASVADVIPSSLPHLSALSRREALRRL